MGNLFESVEKYFVENQWKYHKEDSRGLLLMGVSGKQGNWQSVAHVREKAGQFLFLSLFPTKVPEKLRPQTAEFILRVNYKLAIGGFDMDWTDGEIRYRTSLDLSDQNEVGSLIHHMIECNLSTMDRFYCPLMAMLFSGKTVNQALELEGEDLADGIDSWLSEEGGGGSEE